MARREAILRLPTRSPNRVPRRSTVRAAHAPTLPDRQAARRPVAVRVALDALAVVGTAGLVIALHQAPALLATTVALAWFVFLTTASLGERPVTARIHAGELRPRAGATAAVRRAWIALMGIGSSVAALALAVGLGGRAVPTVFATAVVTLVKLAAVAWLGRWAWDRHRSGSVRALDLPVVLRGRREEVERLLDTITRDGGGGLRPVAVQVVGAPPPDSPGAAEIDGLSAMVADLYELQVIAPGTDVVAGAVTAGATAVVFVGAQPEDGPGLRRLAWDLESAGLDPLHVPVVAPTAAPSVAVVGDTGIPVLGLAARDRRADRWLLREALDRSAALLGLILLSPVAAVVAIAIKRSSPGPVFFTQTRVGIHGQHFTMFKFRTMCTDAEARLDEVAVLNVHAGQTLFKAPDDPRIFPVGRILRRYSIDELPQLLNVVRGEMALVGPRPPLPREVREYDPDMHQRFRVKPGLTGLWQVSGRSDLDPIESARLDTLYVEHWSPWLEVRILLRTIRVVVSAKGAS